MKWMKWSGLCVALFLAFPSVAQYNDSTFYRLNAVASGSWNKTDEKSSFLLNNSLRFGVRRKRVTSNVSGSWIYGMQERTLTNNDVTGTLDCNLDQTDRFYYWVLGNYTSSPSLKINNQYQVGAGAAYDLVDDSVFFFNISDGILYENSDILLNDTAREVYNTFRNSLRLSAKLTLNKVLSVKAVCFLQNSLQYSNDYILKANASASLQINSWLKFTTTIIFNRVSRTQRENLLFTYGITVDNYF